MLAKRERRVVLGLQKDNVLPLGDGISDGGKLRGRRSFRHPELHDRDCCDEGGDKVRSSGPRECVVDFDPAKFARELLDQLLWCLRKQVAEGSLRTVELFLGPQVKERRPIHNTAYALRAAGLRNDDSFLL